MVCILRPPCRDQGNRTRERQQKTLVGLCESFLTAAPGLKAHLEAEPSARPVPLPRHCRLPPRLVLPAQVEMMASTQQLSLVRLAVAALHTKQSARNPRRLEQHCPPRDCALAIPPGRGRAARDGAEASLTERRLQRHGARDTGRRSTGECGSTDRGSPAKRSWSGGAEGAVAVMRRGLPDSAADVEWRRSPRSSSDPNKGSWRGRHPAGYEVGEGTLAVRSSTSAPTDANTRGNGTMPTSTQ